MTFRKFLKTIDVLPGYKTYILVFIGIIINSLYLGHLIGEVGMQVINTMLGFLGLGTISLKLDRMTELEKNESLKE